jgi:hypothetical protein
MLMMDLVGFSVIFLAFASSAQESQEQIQNEQENIQNNDRERLNWGGFAFLIISKKKGEISPTLFPY